MGLAYRLWDEKEIIYVGDMFDITPAQSAKFFGAAHRRRRITQADVIPEMVADDIDAHLARSTTFGQV